jgi:hypothetical protein
MKNKTTRIKIIDIQNFIEVLESMHIVIPYQLKENLIQRMIFVLEIPLLKRYSNDYAYEVNHHTACKEYGLHIVLKERRIPAQIVLTFEGYYVGNHLIASPKLLYNEKTSLEDILTLSSLKKCWNHPNPPLIKYQKLYESFEDLEDKS